MILLLYGKSTKLKFVNTVLGTPNPLKRNLYKERNYFLFTKLKTSKSSVIIATNISLISVWKFA